jgi:hypothetical protein
MSAINRFLTQQTLNNDSQKYLIFSDKRRIKVPYFRNICNFILNEPIVITALREKFKQSTLGKAALAGALAVPLMLASLGPAANDAYAGEVKAATTETITDEEARAITEKAREMRHYAKDPDIRGIGVFINLQENAPENYGEKLGDTLKGVFAKYGIPMEYRVNRSRGTATDLTFYVGEHIVPVRYPDLKSELPRVYAHHKDIWAPKQVSLSNTQPQ